MEVVLRDKGLWYLIDITSRSYAEKTVDNNGKARQKAQAASLL